MNSLLASGDIPGLFEDEDYKELISQCKATLAADIDHTVKTDTDDALYRWFVSQVQRNLHIVFTINPSGDGFQNRTSTSPALYNRCAIDWFGDWPEDALYQVASAFTCGLHLEGIEDQANGHYSLVTSIVSFHDIVHRESERLARRTLHGNRIYVTPRHYLDFIGHFKEHYHEKRKELRDQQEHLNLGVKRLAETEEKVANLRELLKRQEAHLQTKDTLANEKLQQMVKEQKDAEEKKQESESLHRELRTRGEEINQRKSAVEADLVEVKPKLDAAKNAVKSIKKKNLDELRGMANPPHAIQKTMEALVIMLNNDAKTSPPWPEIRRIMRGDDFIHRILQFDSSKISNRVRKRLQKNYLNDPTLSAESVTRASVACGPMIRWIESQLAFSFILEKVDPLQKEVNALESENAHLNDKIEQLQETITELEKSIAQYESEYSTLVREMHGIKEEMGRINTKVDRSKKLLTNLSSEAERWAMQSKSFKKQMDTVVGDVLLSAAFVTYIGQFEELQRSRLTDKWVSVIEQSSNALDYTPGLSVIEYLTKPDDRVRWHANNLPKDDFCVQNAIILQRFNRYPLIIDPTGQAIEFLNNELCGENITKTTFNDASFLKSLENAVRFGTPLLVQDAEHIDPVLNPILNKEVRRIGGRCMIRIGSSEVDMSPTFRIFLSTRDPTCRFDVGVQSKMTFINFSTTPASLQNQCLHLTLKSELPDIDEKRTEQMRLQGEYKMQLRLLEENLLQSLRETKGNVLDNEIVIEKLELLKKRAIDIAEKVKQSDILVEQLAQAMELYNPFAICCSRIYFAMEQLDRLHYLYRFSITSFLGVVVTVLKEVKTSHASTIDPMERVVILTRKLFQTVYSQFSLGMLFEDRLSFALRLAQIFVDGMEIDDLEQQFLFKDGGVPSQRDLEMINGVLEDRRLPLLSEPNMQMAAKLTQLPAFSDGVLVNHIASYDSEWRNFMTAEDAEMCVPKCWISVENDPPQQNVQSIRDSFRALLVVKIFRGDRLLSAMAQFIRVVFDDDEFLKIPPLDLPQIVRKRDPLTSILLCSTPGYDASYRVDDAALSQNKKCTSIAMGTAESYKLSDMAIDVAVRTGSWVLLKNVHLSSQYMVLLEKRLHGMRLSSRNIHPDFRLFMTSEIQQSLPSNLVRHSTVLTFESPPGIAANLMQTFSGMSASEVDRKPTERTRLYLLAAWFHAVLQERLRHLPIGWTKRYEFNQSDLKWTLDTVDQWINIAARGRSNIAPENIPWKAFRTLIGEAIYGGKVDGEYDRLVLDTILGRLFQEHSYDVKEFKFFESTSKTGSALSAPEGISFQQFFQWVQALSSKQQTPEWMGLVLDVQTLNLTNDGLQVIRKLQEIQNVEEEETVFDEAQETLESVDPSALRASWLESLVTDIESWLHMLPESCSFEHLFSVALSNNPLFRFFSREILTASQHLETVRNDMKHVLHMAMEDSKRMASYYRGIVDHMLKGTIPPAWNTFRTAADRNINVWIADIVKRFRQLERISQAMHQQGSSQFTNGPQSTGIVWLGGLQLPEAFLTATRQYVAHANSWSLETLHLEMCIGKGNDSSPQTDDQSFVVEDLMLECAGLERDGKRIMLSEELSSKIPFATLRWVRTDPDEETLPRKVSVRLPLYLNKKREQILCSLDIPIVDGMEGATFYERGSALFAQTF